MHSSIEHAGLPSTPQQHPAVCQSPRILRWRDMPVRVLLVSYLRPVHAKSHWADNTDKPPQQRSSDGWVASAARNVTCSEGA